MLEEQVGSDTTKRYVWSPVYVDAMVLRDRDTDADGTLDERLWVMQDANFNVTASLDGSGAVVERYAYDPFGGVTVYDASWSVRGGGSSYAMTVLWQGMFYDSTSGSYKSRGRTDISPTLGRPFQVDPLGLGPDVNVYRWEGNGPVNVVDPSGLKNFDPSQLKANWGDATGRLYHHIDQVEITIKNCKDKEKLQKIADDLFKNMTQFRDFNHPDNIASVRLFKDGYAGFEARGFAGWLARRVSGDGPDNLHFVKLTTGEQGPAKILSAVTLGNHVLVGVRKWYVLVSGDKIVVGTEAFEQRNSVPADRGFMGPDLGDVDIDPMKGIGARLKGVADTEKIWRQYLTNIAEVTTERQTIGSYAFSKGMPVSEFPNLVGKDPFAQKSWTGLTLGLMPGPMMGWAIASGRNPFMEK